MESIRPKANLCQRRDKLAVVERHSESSRIQQTRGASKLEAIFRTQMKSRKIERPSFKLFQEQLRQQASDHCKRSPAMYSDTQRLRAQHTG